MTFKRISAFLLALMLVVSCCSGLPIRAWAAEEETPAEPAAPTVDTAWYNDEDTVFVIDTAAELRGLAELSKTNNFAGKTIKLGANIVFNKGILRENLVTAENVEEWTPIGSVEELPFEGKIDGQGHSIEGLLMKTGLRQGLIAFAKNLDVTNLKLVRSYFFGESSSARVGVLASTVFGTATVKDFFTNAILRRGMAMGIIGKMMDGSATMERCWNNGVLNGAWSSAAEGVGAMIGQVCNSVTTTLDNCLSTVTLAATFPNGYVGGLVGMGPYNATINMTNCLVDAKFSGVGFQNAEGTTKATVGSVIGNNPGGDKSTYTNVYATAETYASLAGAGGDKSKFTVTSVAKADITGHKARYVLKGLDFVDTFATVPNGIPTFMFNSGYDFSWYDADETVYILNNKAQFAAFVHMSQYNTFAGKTILLTTDITWNEGDAAEWGTTAPANDWLPIGDSANGFAGEFDGLGHTISGIYCKTGGYATVFARVYGATAAVKNLRVVNSHFESDGTADSFHNAAAIVGRATNGYTVSGVYTDAYFKGTKAMGMVGFSDGGATNMSNCWFDGTMDISAATNVGGMISSVPNNQVINITNCLFTGTMTGTAKSGAYIGGIYGIGPHGTTVKLTNSLVAGDMTGVVGGTTGSVAGNNPGGNKSVYTNVYVTNETHANTKGAGGATFPVIPVAEADILGIVPEGFGAEWTAREGDVPAVNTRVLSKITLIYTAQDLYDFSVMQETNNFDGKTILLMNDIVLNEGDAKNWATEAPANVWNPIGKPDASLAFEGTFDGNGHTISGLYYDSASYGGGLFTYTGTKATIKNLKLTNSYIRSTYGTEWSATGSIAAFVNGTKFVNVYSDAIIDTNSGYTGGIGGRVQGWAITAENCEFAGTINGTGATANYIGGLFGGFNANVANTSSIKNCVVSGSVSGNALVGALAGRGSGIAAGDKINNKEATEAQHGNITVDGFKSTATITAAGDYAGGVFGNVEKVAITVNNATVGGTITSGGGISGGITTRIVSGSLTVTDSTVTAAISGTTKLGGFVGQVNVAAASATIKNSTFDGTITGSHASEVVIGGVIGHINAGTATVQNCTVKGTLIGNTYIAGVIAKIENVAATVLVEKNIVTTDIQGSGSNHGGLIGRIMGVNPSVTMKDNLAKATFSTDSWCTAQIVAHAQGNAVKMANNFFVQTANTPAGGIESSGGSITNAAFKVSEALWNYIKSLYDIGLYPDADGFEDSGYQIADLEDLYGFTVYNQIKGMKGKTATLVADITINEGNAADWATTAPKYNWIPVGAVEGAGAYSGNFDGQGHTISGLYCSYASGNGLGLFREINGGTVTNFRLVNSYLENTVSGNYGYNGGIVSFLNNGTVSKVYTDAIVKTVDSYAGGIVGFTGGAAATVSECVFDGTLIARCEIDGNCTNGAGAIRDHARYVGGLIGAVTAKANTISNCVYSGKIYNGDIGAHRTGGLLGGNPQVSKGAVELNITGCFSIGEFFTMGHDNNAYHFNMIMDCRSDRDADNVELKQQPTNVDTLYNSNYVLAVKLYKEDGETVLNNGSNVTGGNQMATSTVRDADLAAMIARIVEQKRAGTCELDFENVWFYANNNLPQLRWMLTEEDMAATLVGPELLPVTKTEYNVGDELDMSTIVLANRYSDDSYEVITEGYEVTGFTSEAEGTVTVTVTYGEQSWTFDVTVVEAKVITGIEIEAPTKTEYELGEELDTTGLVVYVVYSDGTKEVLTEGFEVVGFGSEMPGTSSVAVIYGEYMATFDVTIKEPVVETGITITAPTKTEYEIGEELVLDGLTVTVLYSNGTSVVITEGYTVTGFDSETAGVKTITVTYGTFTATFEVTVNEPVPEKVMTGIEITTLPTKLSYNVGAALSTKGMVVTAIYSDGSTEVITGYELAGFDSATAGTKTITVTYGEFYAKFEVQVVLNVTIKQTVVNTETGVSVTWADAGVDGYKVYRREYVSGTAGEWVLIAETTDPAYLDTTAVNGTKYGYAVAAVSGTDEGAKSSETTVTYIDTVKGITLYNTAAGMQIRWRANEKAGKYWIYRSEFVDGQWTEWVSLKSHADLENTVYVDRTAVSGVKYRYTVRAMIGSTQYSAYTDGAEYTRLSNVLNVSYSNMTNGIKLSWKQHDGADEIWIYRSAYNADGTSNSWGPVYLKLAGDATEWLDTEAENGVKYRYSIVAYKEGATSAQKEHAKVVRLTKAQFVGLTEVYNGLTVTWEKNEAASKYFIYRYRRVDGKWEEQYRKVITDKNVTSWNDQQAVVGETYRYVLVVNKDGLNSLQSEELRATRLGNTTVSLLASTGRTRVTIKENVRATAYTIQRRVADGEWETIVADTTELVHWDETTVAGTTYEYRVLATDGTNISYGKGYTITAK